MDPTTLVTDPEIFVVVAAAIISVVRAWRKLAEGQKHHRTEDLRRALLDYR